MCLQTYFGVILQFDQVLPNIYFCILIKFYQIFNLQLAPTIVAETFKAVSEREIVHGELVITLVELLMVVMKVIIRMIMMIIRMIMVVMIIIMMMMEKMMVWMLDLGTLHCRIRRHPILKIPIFWDNLYVLLTHLVCSWRI